MPAPNDGQGSAIESSNCGGEFCEIVVEDRVKVVLEVNSVVVELVEFVDVEDEIVDVDVEDNEDEEVVAEDDVVDVVVEWVLVEWLDVDVELVEVGDVWVVVVEVDVEVERMKEGA